LGLGFALEAAGKHVQMVFSDGIPESLRHLIGVGRISGVVEWPVDCVIVLDCSDLERVGNVILDYGTPDINIDHHITNLEFAKVNIVDGQSAATSEILAKHLSDLGLTATPEARDAMLTGIITDTLGFRTSNVSPTTLRLTADMMESGANLPELYKKALSQRSLNALRYWGAGLSQVMRDGRLVWTALSLEDRKLAGYPGRDDADLINILGSVRDADIVLIFVEQSKDSVKISWRAQNGFDVSQVALQFGGGGHRAASGAEVKGTLSDVQNIVLEATKKILDFPPNEGLSEMTSTPLQGDK
jgi:phosphoesterase RecJ-like protein